MNWTIKLVKSITRSSRSTSVPPRFKRQGKHLHFSSQRPSRIRWQVCHPHLTTLASSIHICCHIATHLQPRRQKDRQGGKPVLVSPSTLIVVRLFIVIFVLELHAVPDDFHIHAGDSFDSSKMFQAQIHP